MDGKTLEEVIEDLRIPSQNRGISSRLIRLDDESAYCVLAAAFIGRFVKMTGPEEQHLLIRLLGEGFRTETDLRAWLGDSFPVNSRRWDSCRKRAEQFLAAGIKVLTPVAPLSGDAPQCPGVLFGKDCPPDHPPLLAVFNSRKPKSVSPGSTWLDVMRRFLSSMDPGQIGLIGSTGTLTYDLASVLALRRGFLRLMVAPFPITAVQNQLFKIFGEETSGIPVVSCMLDGAACPAKLPMRCRDRLLAALADFHLVLEIRSCGNLLAVLAQIQSKSPRPQFVLIPDTPGASNAGNFILLKKFSEHAVGLESPVSMRPVETRLVAPADSFKSSSIPWRDYLFHYTRACSGPWPGETYRQYLLGLLDDRPLSGRSALDVLARIAQEGLLRATCRMVRGRTAVVCWSSLPPGDLFLMRKWRRALARWTVEPYGVAVRRDILRALGAKPAIYGSGQVYSMLADSEKFRFQSSHSAPSASWRHEREWRIKGDLSLREITPGQGFFFVQTAREARKLYGRPDLGLPVVAINERGG